MRSKVGRWGKKEATEKCEEWRRIDKKAGKRGRKTGRRGSKTGNGMLEFGGKK